MTHQIQLNHAADIFNAHRMVKQPVYEDGSTPFDRVTIEDLRTFEPYNTFEEFLEGNEIEVYEEVIR